MISLFDLPYHEARALVDTGAPVYLSVNPVEYHGPHLSLRNDALLSAYFMERLHGALRASHPEWPFLVASPLELGVDPAPGLGSRAVSFLHARRLIVDACLALAQFGARRVVVMTFHGSPLHNVAIHAGVEALQARGVAALSPFNYVLQERLQLDNSLVEGAVAHIPDAAERRRVLQTLTLDFHAGFFESSLALVAAPESVSPRYRSLPDCPVWEANAGLQRVARWAERAGRSVLAEEIRFMSAAIGWTSLRPFPGYTGSPRYASPEAGQVFADLILSRYLAGTKAVFDGAPAPRTPLAWLAPLTLSGRLQGPKMAESLLPGVLAGW